MQSLFDLGGSGCKCASRRTYTGSFAFPGGIERVSKIVMCIGTKLCFRTVYKNCRFPRIWDTHLNAVFVFKLITWPEVSTVGSPVRAVINDRSKLGLAVRSRSRAALSSPSADPQWRWSLLHKLWCQYCEPLLWPSRMVTSIELLSSVTYSISLPFG